MHDADHRHHLCQLHGLPRAEAMLSSDPMTRTVIVFVHGFGGHAATTWAQFQRLADEMALDDPWWRRADLYFYGYASVSQSTNESARDLAKFLERVLPQPPEDFFRPMLDAAEQASLGTTLAGAAIRSGPYLYTEAVFVGHSEGGLLLRLAVRLLAQRHAAASAALSVGQPLGIAALVERSSAEAWSADRMRQELLALDRRRKAPVPPALEAALRLFAPAIAGARLTGPLGFVYQSFIGGAARPFLAGSKAFKDLNAESPVLAAARAETEKLFEQFPELPALTAHVLWGKADNVVTDLAYGHDIAESVPEQTHTSVCKPRPSFLRPLAFVKRGLG